MARWSLCALLLLLSVSPLAAQEEPAPASLTVEPAKVEVTASDTLRFQVVAHDQAGNPLPAVPAYWAVTPFELGTIDSTGLFVASAAGQGTVTAVAGKILGTARVTVLPVPPVRLEIELPSDRLLVGSRLPVEIRGYDRQGSRLWLMEGELRSLDPAVVDVRDGHLRAVSPGTTRLVARAGEAEVSREIRVFAGAVRRLEVEPRQGRVVTGEVVTLTVRGGAGGEGDPERLWPEWWLDRPGAGITSDGKFVAEEPGRYGVMARLGESIGTAEVVVLPRPVRGSLSLVGRYPISAHSTGDVRVFGGRDGRDYAYLGTAESDRLLIFDVTDPSQPVLTDSVVVDARFVLDVKVNEDRTLAVFNREGASDRRNGIVVLDLADAAHPTVLSQYTETLTGGVHNLFIEGSYVYATHTGSGALHIIDISDPAHPREVGRWRAARSSPYLHDMFVRNGIAYLAYWRDGLVVLDVGHGGFGGSPETPAFIGQLVYDIEGIYGPGGPRGAHSVFRAGRYAFVGDEVFPADYRLDAPIEARGYIHVVDLSNPRQPREVAFYRAPEAGAHNMWVDGDRLFVAYYQAGLRVVDISGELRGDLYRQGREVARYLTRDGQGRVPNVPMAFGVQVHKGHLFVSDLNNGLWILRLEED